jgi:hypothetical protein
MFIFRSVFGGGLNPNNRWPIYQDYTLRIPGLRAKLAVTQIADLPVACAGLSSKLG